MLSYDLQLREWRKQKNAVDIPPPMKPQESVFRQLFTTDSTMEALASVLEKNPRGVLFPGTNSRGGRVA